MYLVGFVSEEVNLFETLVFDVAQTIGLIPSSGEDIKRDLTADGVGEVIVSKFLPEDLYKGSPDTMDLSGLVRKCAF